MYLIFIKLKETRIFVRIKAFLSVLCELEKKKKMETYTYIRHVDYGTSLFIYLCVASCIHHKYVILVSSGIS